MSSDKKNKIQCKRCGEFVRTKLITLAKNRKNRIVEICNMCTDNFNIIYFDKKGERRYNGK